jgi:tetratricopeptide (TPR) repeat protein
MSEASNELYDQAKILRLDGRYEEALLKAKGAVNLNPNSANAWWEVALSSNALKKIDAAIEAFEKTVELSEEFAQGWSYYGKALQSAGRKEDAINAFEMALELDDSESTALIQLMQIYYSDEANKPKLAGSRYFCKRFFRASCSKNQQKTTRPPMPSAAPIRPRHLVSTQQGVET